MKIKVKVGSNDQDTVPQGTKDMKSKIITMNFRRADFGFFRYLLGRVLWDKPLEGSRNQESYLGYYSRITLSKIEYSILKIE